MLRLEALLVELATVGFVIRGAVWLVDILLGSLLRLTGLSLDSSPCEVPFFDVEPCLALCPFDNTLLTGIALPEDTSDSSSLLLLNEERAAPCSAESLRSGLVVLLS